MKHFLLHIENQADADLVLQLVKRLKIAYVQLENQLSEVDKLLKAILLVRNFEQEGSSFGDASEWQRQERQER